MSQYVDIKFDTAVLRSLDQATVRALRETGTAVLKDIKKAQVIPLDTSHLQNDSTFVDDSEAAIGHVDIVSNTPYARRLYYNPESVQVSGYTRKDGVKVRPYTAGKMHIRQSADEGHNRANSNAKDHWFDAWADGGEHSDVAQRAFAAAYKREAGL